MPENNPVYLCLVQDNRLFNFVMLHGLHDHHSQVHHAKCRRICQTKNPGHSVITMRGRAYYNTVVLPRNDKALELLVSITVTLGM